MGVKRLASRGLTFASQAPRHPAWAAGHLCNYVDSLSDHFLAKSLGDHSVVSVNQSLEMFGGWHQEEIEAAIAELRLPESPEQSTFFKHDPSSAWPGDGSREFVTLLFVWCRLAKPSLVVETGVAHGFSTSAILQALEKNGEGRLISIDLPHLSAGALRTIGAAVDPELRSRWVLRLGPAPREIRRVVAEVGENVDLFVQDASHTFRGQLAEYRPAWRGLSRNGLLVSDDVTETFEILADEVDRVPTYVGQDKQSPIGLLRK